MRVAQLIGPELQQLLQENPSDVQALLNDVHPEDMADIVDEFDDERAIQLLTQLPTDYAAQVFERIGAERQAKLAALMNPESTAQLALEMEPDERADFFSLIPSELSGELLERIEEQSPEVASEVEQLTQWPKTSAGGLMTTGYISLRPKLTIRDAVEEIRRCADESETLDTVFIVEGDNQLAGVLSLRKILIAEPTEVIEDVMTRNVIAVPPDLDQEEVARKLAKYDLKTIPVVNDAGKLLGVITSDDILDVLTEEQSEDVHKMGAVAPIREGYFETSFALFLRKRAPWLCILFMGEFITTHILKSYEHSLSAVTQLAFYLPLLISAGGNSGAQSSTLIIRGLAVGDVSTPDWWRVLSRELLQGIVLGSILAVLGVARCLLFGDGVAFAILIGTTVVLIVTIGCVLGSMTPILLHRLGLDPATSSSPFIATFCDALGILMYLSLARLILSEAMRVGLASGWNATLT